MVEVEHYVLTPDCDLFIFLFPETDIEGAFKQLYDLNTLR